MTPLPRPIAAQSRFADSEWTSCTLDQHQFVQTDPVVWPGFETRGLYSAEQMEAYAAAKVREALESAANEPQAHIGQLESEGWIEAWPEELELLHTFGGSVSKRIRALTPK